jgi:steroid 5-alpha reductase family enzyme
MLAAHNPLPLGLMDMLGVFVMMIALWGGHKADEQLARFKKDPAKHGQICDIGLWGRSRHPNYFFEVMFWSGWPLLALSGGWWLGVLAIAGPVFIYWLLRHVSGEPLVETHMAKRYGEAFEHYRRRVPPFFPRLFLN